MHKHLLTFLCAIGAATSLHAQATDAPAGNIGLSTSSPIARGRWMVGSDLAVGNLAFATDGHGNSYTTYSVGLLPKAAYFITDHLAVGAGIGLTLNGVRHSYTNQIYSITPFARYYFGRDKGTGYSQTRWFVEGGFGASWLRAGYTNAAGEQEWESSGIQHTGYIMPGASIFLNKSIALDAGVYFQNTGSARFGKSNSFGFNLGFKVFLGKR